MTTVVQGPARSLHRLVQTGAQRAASGSLNPPVMVGGLPRDSGAGARNTSCIASVKPPWSRARHCRPLAWNGGYPSPPCSMHPALKGELCLSFFRTCCPPSRAGFKSRQIPAVLRHQHCARPASSPETTRAARCPVTGPSKAMTRQSARRRRDCPPWSWRKASSTRTNRPGRGLGSTSGRRIRPPLCGLVSKRPRSGLGWLAAPTTSRTTGATTR